MYRHESNATMQRILIKILLFYFEKCSNYVILLLFLTVLFIFAFLAKYFYTYVFQSSNILPKASGSLLLDSRMTKNFEKVFNKTIFLTLKLHLLSLIAVCFNHMKSGEIKTMMHISWWKIFVSRYILWWIGSEPFQSQGSGRSILSFICWLWNYFLILYFIVNLSFSSQCCREKAKTRLRRRGSQGNISRKTRWTPKSNVNCAFGNA